VAGRLQKAAAILIVVSAAGRPVSAASLLDISGASAFAGDARRAGLAFDWGLSGVETRVQATFRYAPTPWLSLHLDAALQRARFADGLLKPIPGAARRYGQAGATLRPGGGWNASVFVTSFGARPSTDDDPARVRSASFVSGRITRYLS
jgi:hypothetical protein